jgi:hypothetical protein
VGTFAAGRGDASGVLLGEEGRRSEEASGKKYDEMTIRFHDTEDINVGDNGLLVRRRKDGRVAGESHELRLRGPHFASDCRMKPVVPAIT